MENAIKVIDQVFLAEVLIQLYWKQNKIHLIYLESNDLMYISQLRRELTTRDIQFYAAQLVVISKQRCQIKIIFNALVRKLMVIQDKLFKLINFGSHRSNLRALGVKIYELFTGKTPFKNEIEYIMFQNIFDKEPNQYLIKDQYAVDFIQILLKKMLKEDQLKLLRMIVIIQYQFNENFETWWLEQKEMKEQPQFVIKMIIHSQQKIQRPITKLINDGVSLILSGIFDKFQEVLI